MGSLTLRLPSIQGRTADEKIESLRRSIAGMVDELNLADWSAYRTMQDISGALDAKDLESPDSETQGKLAGYAALRALVVKTADYAVQNSETFKLQLRSDYVAVSDFGEYWQNATMTIGGTSFGIEQLFEYAEGVNNAYTVNSKQYVKTGLLYYDGATPVYGVGVGNLATTVSSGNTVIDKTQGELVTVTPGRIGFWQTGSEIAYITSKKIYFPSSTLVAYDAVLTGTLTAASGSKLGPWTVADSCIWRGSSTIGAVGGLYFGTSGLSVGSRFVVDSVGNATLVGLKASSATIDGYITAYSLNVQNCTVTGSFSASVLGGGTLDFSSFSVRNFSADYISGGTIDAAYINVMNLNADYITTGTLDAKRVTLGYDNTGFRYEMGDNMGVTTYGAKMFAGGNACFVSTGGAKIYGSGNWTSWTSGYITNSVAPTTSSDRDVKTAIQYEWDTRFDALFDALRPVRYELKAMPGRRHAGMIAQDVEQAMTGAGIRLEEFAGLLRLEHPAKDAGDLKEFDYFLSYEEFIPLVIGQLQALKKRVGELEERT